MASAPHPDWTELRFDWLWVYDGFVPTVETWSNEIAVPASVFFVLRGHGRIHVRGSVIEVPKGCAFLAGAGTRKQWFAEGTRLLSVAFLARWPSGLPLSTPELNCVFALPRVRTLYTASRVLFRAIYGPRLMVDFEAALNVVVPDFASWCKREAAFRAWFSAYMQTLQALRRSPTPRPRATDGRLCEIVRRLDAWALAEPIEWDRLARGLGVGPRRLEQLFAAEFESTPREYLDRRRIEAARLLLLHSKSSVKEIAYDLGFRHASHFTKWFRHHTTLSPSSFREGSGDAA